MTDLTTKLESEALRAGSRSRTNWAALLATVIPFVAAFGVLVVVGGQVRDKRAELAAKQLELGKKQTELETLHTRVGSLKKEQVTVQAALDAKKAELEAADARVRQAATLLSDPSAGTAEQRVEQANQVLVGGTPTAKAQDLWRQGFAAYKRGDYTRAEQLYRASKNADSKYAPAHNSLGNLKAHQGDYPAALEFYRRALELRPSYAPSHYNIALVYEQQGKRAEALAALNEALRVRPGYPEALAEKRRLQSAPVRQATE
jgi:tetratricopeptide (TPR) repeat protein